MCDSCGCGQPSSHSHSHAHSHDHVHTHDSTAAVTTPAAGRVIEVQSNALAANQRLADENRGWFRAKGWTVFNLLSSPGSGKTALLERTLRELPHAAALTGDLQTDRDAVRLRRSGAPAIQITTGEACHLDAHMVAHALDRLNPDGIEYLFIENVGNLVCPAAFDLGETRRVVLLSVTEGEDKPLKYPAAFFGADLVLVTKTDMAAAADFCRETALENIRAAAPHAAVLELSAKTGEGFGTWLDAIRAVRAARA